MEALAWEPGSPATMISNRVPIAARAPRSNKSTP